MEYSHGINYFRITILIVSFFAPINAQSLDLSVRPGSSVRAGDTLVVTCKVSGKQPLDLVRIVRRIKDKEYEVATNDYLKEKYRGTGRYWITAWDNTVGLLELTISDAKGEDAGNFGCKYIPSSSSAQTIVKLTDVIVDVSPSSVDLMYEASDGKWYKAGEGERVQFKTRVRCNVQMDGTDFEPNVQISVGEGAYLTTTKSIHKELVDNDGFTKITHSVKHTVQLDGSDLRLHGKILVCSATMPKFNPVKGSIVLEVPHKPQLSCSPEWYAQPCAENYTVTCRALMFPHLLSHVWSWGEQQQQYKLLDGKPNSEEISRFRSGYLINKNGEYVFNLVVDELKNRDFGVYQLTVSNQQGSDRISIRILKEPTVTLPQVSTSQRPLQLIIKEEPSAYQLSKGSGAGRSFNFMTSYFSIIVLVSCKFLVCALW